MFVKVRGQLSRVVLSFHWGLQEFAQVHLSTEPSCCLSMLNLFWVCLQLFIKNIFYELLWISSLIIIICFIICLRSKFETFLILGTIRNFQLKSKYVSFKLKGSEFYSNLVFYHKSSDYCRWTVIADRWVFEYVLSPHLALLATSSVLLGKAAYFTAAWWWKIFVKSLLVNLRMKHSFFGGAWLE